MKRGSRADATADEVAEGREAQVGAREVHCVVREVHVLSARGAGGGMFGSPRAVLTAIACGPGTFETRITHVAHVDHHIDGC